jgi:hypothetical protein
LQLSQITKDTYENKEMGVLAHHLNPFKGFFMELMGMSRVYYGFLVLFAVILALGLILSTQAHENSHRQNCVYHGGNASVKLEAFGLAGGHTTCQINEKVVGEQAERDRNFVDAMIEAVSYQTTALFVGVALIGFLVVTTQFLVIEAVKRQQ